MKFLFTVITILFFSLLNTHGKNSVKNFNSPDNKKVSENVKAIAIAGISSEGEINDRILDNLHNVTVPGSYIQLHLKDAKLTTLTNNHISLDNISNKTENDLQEWLNQNKAGQEILSEWFNRQPDGSFNTNYLENTELLDDELLDKIVNEGQNNDKLISHFANSPLNDTYLFVFDFSNVRTMDEYYKKNSTAQNSRILRGYIAKVKTFIFKFDFNQSVAETFLGKYYTETDDIAAINKQDAFVSSEFPFFLVTINEEEIASVAPRATQKKDPAKIKSNEELLGEMAQLAVGNIIDHVKKGELTLKVQKAVMNTKPVTAKIGAAQKVKFDQRYGIFENKINSSGKVIAKRKSVVKSMKVADNKKIQEDHSEFYKIAGGKVDEKGMYLKKKFDTGINLFAGKTINGLSGNTGRFEYYFSKAMGGAVMPGNKARGLTSVKLYFEAAQNKKSYTIFDLPENFTFVRGSIGMEKEFHPLAFMHCGPFIGYGLEYATWGNSDYLLSSNFTEIGARLGINLRHNFQIIGSATHYNQIKTVLMDEKRDVIEPDFDYSSTFNDRTGWGYSIGLRIML